MPRLPAPSFASLALIAAVVGCQKPDAAAPAPAVAPVAAPPAEAPPTAAVALPAPASAAAAPTPAPAVARPLPPGSPTVLPPGHPPVDAPAAIAIGEFAAADLRIAELRKHRAEHAGKPVRIRGRVTKVNSGILGRNWLHLQDGSEGELVVTTEAEAAPGALVLATGKVAVDKDVGAGYQYDLLVEDATLEVEQPAP